MILDLESILIGFTYFLIKTTTETIINLINTEYDPKSIIRGHSILWLDYENKYSYFERPMLIMPKKFWLGNLLCVDIDLFKDQAVGINALFEKTNGTVSWVVAHPCYPQSSLKMSMIQSLWGVKYKNPEEDESWKGLKCKKKLRIKNLIPITF